MFYFEQYRTNIMVNIDRIDGYYDDGNLLKLCAHIANDLLPVGCKSQVLENVFVFYNILLLRAVWSKYYVCFKSSFLFMYTYFQLSNIIIIVINRLVFLVYFFVCALRIETETIDVQVYTPQTAIAVCNEFLISVLLASKKYNSYEILSPTIDWCELNCFFILLVY